MTSTFDRRCVVRADRVGSDASYAPYLSGDGVA